MSSGVRLAPSLAHGLRRSGLIVLASAVVALGTYAVEGPPSRARARRERPGPPFGPTFPFGLVQLLGQGALLVGGVYVARRWLRMKL